jgi:hypothetical protein
MKKAKIEGAFLPWRDVLHEGPVPDNLSLKELSQLRAQFIIERGWGMPEDIIESFIRRDRELESFRKYEKVILWFEHDLYDQLQIIQILDWFYKNDTDDADLAIICTNQYLGRLTAEEMKGLVGQERPITESHLKLASKAWSAFRSSSPEKWRGLLDMDSTVLPFMEGAVIRLLEEFPACSNGLSRTAEQALKAVSSGEKHPGRVFACVQNMEERVFMGGSSFWVILHELLESSPPLLALPEGKKLTLPASEDQELTITPVGLEVLSGNSSWLDVSKPDRWIGGVHLQPGNIWCWNSDSYSIKRRV